MERGKEREELQEREERCWRLGAGNADADVDASDAGGSLRSRTLARRTTSTSTYLISTLISAAGLGVGVRLCFRLMSCRGVEASRVESTGIPSCLLSSRQAKAEAEAEEIFSSRLKVHTDA